MPTADTLTIRPPTPDDAGAVTLLCNVCDIAEYGVPDGTEADVRAQWVEPGFDITRSAWVAGAEGGALQGYAWVMERVPKSDLVADLYVHPDHIGGALGDMLLSRLEARSRELAAEAPADVTPTLGLFNASVNPWKRGLLENRGFAPARTFLRMTIDLHAGFEAPRLPSGIGLRAFDPVGHAREVHAALTEAFADHYRPRRESFEDWKARRFGPENFDPTLWLVAWEGESIAGALLGYLSPDLGWVQELGVLRTWRGRGIGLALLLESFAAFESRGQHRVSLGVDAESLTGATRLYERAGMRVERHHDLFLKALR